MFNGISLLSFSVRDNARYIRKLHMFNRLRRVVHHALRYRREARQWREAWERTLDDKAHWKAQAEKAEAEIARLRGVVEGKNGQWSREWHKRVDQEARAEMAVAALRLIVNLKASSMREHAEAQSEAIKEGQRVLAALDAHTGAT